MFKKFLSLMVFGLLFTSNASSKNLYLNKYYTNSKNHVYSATYNNHGAVLTINNKQYQIYIGKDCDAYSPKYGTGTWSQFNGGFIVSFKNIDISFPHQEVTMLEKTDCYF